MIQIIKTIRVKADYDITREFDSVEDLLNELKQFGYEGEYDENDQEFNDALNEYFDEPLHTKAVANSNNQHYIDNIEIDTENFSTYYTF
jgi:N-acetyl-anhydromuramyl-L-alanine amidase AmpD